MGTNTRTRLLSWSLMVGVIFFKCCLKFQTLEPRHAWPKSTEQHRKLFKTCFLSLNNLKSQILAVKICPESHYKLFNCHIAHQHRTCTSNQQYACLEIGHSALFWLAQWNMRLPPRKVGPGKNVFCWSKYTCWGVARCRYLFLLPYQDLAMPLVLIDISKGTHIKVKNQSIFM